ncbi:uncharacterized protein SPSK_05935 [Sporothrix schenckii 1099-18]|uniref:Zn(2)-C6 fungal-type domain-containing protein n=1 Tax=Sporothrix schenckii 1099-18 TaxID=1397361 RepID=A0A0F2MJN4_SPOSC|nr:uncharacterized protein SPSK_05935 [Sporothrix schenckii 1099-18]KJR89274.1 hypothetical protein SPSK_05935 [Sporothrix schenckii 1099-18]
MASATTQPRISQRQSLACRECTRSKRKCSKDIPCTRCRRLGLDCSREVVRLRRVISQNGREIAFLDSLRAELASAAGHGGRHSGGHGGGQGVARVLQRLADRVQFLQSGQTGTGDDGDPTGVSGLSMARTGSPEQGSPPHASHALQASHALASADARPHPHGQRPKSRSASASSQDMQDSLIVTALEHVAWGRNTGSCYPHRRCTCQYNTNGPTHYYSQQILYSLVAARVVRDNLPGRDRAEAMVRFHLRHMAWHHSCLHAPTFLAQCTRFWTTGETEHPQWLALYLAVLAATHFCLLHSPKYGHAPAFGATATAPPLAVDPSDPQSAQSLFQAMLDVLHEGQFLQNVSLFAVQAIVISTEVAHNLGLSQLNATLMAAAVRIAECLGVHKIADDPARRPGVHGHANANADAKERTDGVFAVERREREIGRRVWLQMVIQDHFAMPFTDAYGIQPQQYATGLPRNCDDTEPHAGDQRDGLVEQPPTRPTIVSYNIVLSTLARLVPELADGLGPLRARKPLHEQYEHILAMDHKMRRVVRAIPPFFLRQDPVLEAQVPWLAIARQSMAITAAEKIIMVHRPFLFRSFQAPPKGVSSATPPPYIHTRRTCVSAAMTILREHRNITEAGDMSLWTHTAFCITAALLLSFEVLCSKDVDVDVDVDINDTNDTTDADADADATAREQQATYRSAIQYARTYLSGRLHDVLAQRGVLLIDSLFPGGPTSDAPTPSLKTNEHGGSNIRFDDVVSAFMAGWAMFGVQSDLQRGGGGSVGSVGSGPGSLGVPSPSPGMGPSGMVGRYAAGPGPPGSSQILPSLPPPPQPFVPDVGVLPGMGVYGHPGQQQQQYAEPMPPMEDFDAWFQHIFATGNGTTFE